MLCVAHFFALTRARPSFRRTGPSSWVNLAFGAMLGVISGQYIFGEPLRQMAEERRLEEAAKAQQQHHSSSGGASAADSK